MYRSFEGFWKIVIRKIVVFVIGGIIEGECRNYRVLEYLQMLWKSVFLFLGYLQTLWKLRRKSRSFVNENQCFLFGCIAYCSNDPYFFIQFSFVDVKMLNGVLLSNVGIRK